jgi:hypothetical protein
MTSLSYCLVGIHSPTVEMTKFRWFSFPVFAWSSFSCAPYPGEQLRPEIPNTMIIQIIQDLDIIQ